MEQRLLKTIISDAEKKKYIKELRADLPFLRMKAGVSQDDLASIIGVSRQTYGAIERSDRPMGWNTYLSLIFYFDNKSETRDLIRGSDAFPHKFVAGINSEDTATDEMMLKLSENYPDVFDKLDENARTTIKTLIMIEYARCTNQTGESVVKSFDGMNFMKKPSRSDKVDGTIKKMRGRKIGR